MKFTISLLAAASLVVAQINDIPECAKNCVGEFLSGSNIAGCSLVDYGCICRNEDFINKIACCLVPVCDDKGKSDTIALANKLCKAFSVDLPTAVTCSSAASATPTVASSGSALSSSGASRTTSAASSGAQSTAATSSGAAASTSKPNAAPTNVAGLVGAAAALVFAL